MISTEEQQQQQVLPSLAESNALMDFLQSALQQIELQSGSEDEEARGLLQQLEQQASLLQAMQAHGRPSEDHMPRGVLTDLQLAEQLDR